MSGSEASNTPSSLSISVIISTYGEPVWEELAETRALPSAAAQDPFQIVLHHEPDGTIASTRNNAAAQAKGDALVFLDADDELGEGYLEAMRKAIESNLRPGTASRGKAGLGVAWRGTAWHGEVLYTPSVSYVRGRRVAPPVFLDRGITLEHDNFLIIGTVISRRLFMEVGGFSDYEHGFEDWSLWAKAWKAGAEIVKVPDAVYRAFVNPQSKHRIGWRNRQWQVETHQRIQKELFPA